MGNSFDIICFSHLRWNFVFQRPQHLLTRCSRDRRVVFVEEPHFGADVPRLDLSQDPSGVIIASPRLPDALRTMLDDLVRRCHIRRAVHWYYTPMALEFSKHLPTVAIVYDCMDELSAFAGAPAGLADAERDLLKTADVVFTGGQALFEAKRRLHPNIHVFPSSVDLPHFAQARQLITDPPDQSPIPKPRAGFFGVIDERLDTPLLAAASALRPDWHFVLIGPVVKVDPAALPQAANLHYLGSRPYADLPRYIASWDVALLPFARNAATRFISPTKTPEYLAAGRPVVSTSIRDVVRPYGELGLAHIADDPTAFVAAMDRAVRTDPIARLKAADSFLADMSWDLTWAAMMQKVDDAVQARSERAAASSTTYGRSQPEPSGPSAAV